MKRECGARKRDGTPCRSPAMPNGRCRIHGGKVPTGAALPQFKTGRYSKYLPARLQERYLAAAQDDDLVSLREDLALLDARLADVLKRVDTGESGERWRSLQKAYQEFTRQRTRGDVAEMGRALAVLEAEIVAGVQDYAAWAEVRSLLDQRGRLAEGERRRLSELQQTITAQKAMTLIAAVQAAVTRHVDDRAVLAAISADLIRLVDPPPGGLPQP